MSLVVSGYADKLLEAIINPVGFIMALLKK